MTGHKAERSLRSYNKLRDAERKRIADCLDKIATSSALACKELEVFTGARAGCGCGESSRTDYVEDFQIIAPGAVFKNLTVNIGGTPEPRKCLNLSQSFSKKKKLADCSAEALSASFSAST